MSRTSSSSEMQYVFKLGIIHATRLTTFQYLRYDLIEVSRKGKYKLDGPSKYSRICSSFSNATLNSIFKTKLNNDETRTDTFLSISFRDTHTHTRIRQTDKHLCEYTCPSMNVRSKCHTIRSSYRRKFN